MGPGLTCCIIKPFNVVVSEHYLVLTIAHSLQTNVYHHSFSLN